MRLLGARHIIETCNLGQELTQYTNQLVVDQLATFETRVFQPFDLLFHDALESSGADEQRWGRTLVNKHECQFSAHNTDVRTYRKVVQNRPDIAILDLVEGIN
jgi:hypothetical protein